MSNWSDTCAKMMKTLCDVTDYDDSGFELRGYSGIIRIKGERIRLYQSRLSLTEPDSGFEWSSLEEQEIERPAPTSTYVDALAELIDALEGKATLRSDGAVGRLLEEARIRPLAEDRVDLAR